MGFIGVGNRGSALLKTALRLPGVSVAAICDIDKSRLAAALDTVQSAGNPQPAGYSAGPDDYRNMLSQAKLDAVLVATPNIAHAAMAEHAMEAKVPILSEVTGAVSLDDCWRLVRAYERTRSPYALAENVCYYRSNMAVRHILQQGLFGDLTYAECGYVHDTRRLQFNADGSDNWRSERAKEIGNRYPTHAIGPVAQWLGINRGDRFATIVAMSSPPHSLQQFVSKRFGADSPAARSRFGGDTTVCLIKTARGRLIDLRFDPYSAKPHPSTTYHSLQGATGSYKDEEDVRRIWLEGRAKKFEWEDFAPYEKEFDDPLWRKFSDQATEYGHRGGDFMMLYDFVEAVRGGRPMPIDVYDSAAWSSIIALSEESVKGGGVPVEFPDFTGDRWESRR